MRRTCAAPASRSSRRSMPRSPRAWFGTPTPRSRSSPRAPMSCRSIRPRDAMPHIHLDAVGGIAGDMFVAALLDAFPDFRSRVLADARAVLPAGYEGRLRETRSDILRGLGFGLAGEALRRDHGHGHDHRHSAGGFLNMVGRIRTAALADGSAEQAVAIL